MNHIQPTSKTHPIRFILLCTLAAYAGLLLIGLAAITAQSARASDATLHRAELPLTPTVTPTPPAARCPDVVSPPGVDVLDIQAVAERWPLTAANPDPDDNPGTPNYEPRFDIDDDGDIDVLDIMHTAGQWSTIGDPPAIEFTYIPLYGSSENLRGRVGCVQPADYKVAVYIYVLTGWWTKPTFASPLTPIQSDGAWVADVTTGGNDRFATQFAAFLVPNGYSPPPMAGDSTLPAELFDFPHAMAERPGRWIEFSGYTWQVKAARDGRVGPGPNYFSDAEEDVWVDDDGRLHMRIVYRNGRWWCTEVINNEILAYGTYTFTLASPVDILDENVVLGLFTWDSDAPQFNYREIDIEMSRFGQPAADNAQFVVQPWDSPGNRRRFDVQLQGIHSIHRFDWRADQVQFDSFQGQGFPPTPGDLIESWLYTGADVPPDGGGNARINLWLFEGSPPADGEEVEVIVEAFAFTPQATRGD